MRGDIAPLIGRQRAIGLSIGDLPENKVPLRSAVDFGSAQSTG